MGDTLSHRGPDACGVWTAPSDAFGVTHARLAINGETAQPVFHDSACLAYNGELYGVGDDTAYLWAHMETGKRLDTLVGMFAFAWWDRGRLTLVRDRFGIKPLYYALSGDEIIFASEMKAVASILPHLTFDEEWLADYRAFQVGLDGRTPFKEIRELRPGHRLAQDKEHRWWRLEFGDDSPKHAASEVRDLIEQAVHATSTTGAASYLSGGLDSSTVATIARVPAYCGDVQGHSEWQYAVCAAMGGCFGVQRVPITGGGFDTIMGDVFDALDHPVAGPGSYSQYLVALRVADGHKVALSGNGGDEVFCGYARFPAAFDLELPPGYFPLRKSLWGIRDPLERYRQAVTRGADGRHEWFDARVGSERGLDAMQRFEIEVLLPGLLHVEDRVGMAHGLETRVPLLDHRLVEYVCSLSPKLRYSGTLKGLMKEAVAEIVPRAIRCREDKIGFDTPWHEWVGTDGTRGSWGAWSLDKWARTSRYTDALPETLRLP